MIIRRRDGTLTFTERKWYADGSTYITVGNSKEPFAEQNDTEFKSVVFDTSSISYDPKRRRKKTLFVGSSKEHAIVRFLPPE